MMDKHKASEVIEKQLCEEVCSIAESIDKNQMISIQELERLDKLYHTLKSKATYEAMEEANEYSGMSGRRGRGADGRYVSRDANESFSEGYDRGYSEAMSRSHGGNSGHYYYPMPYYNETRRW